MLFREKENYINWKFGMKNMSYHLCQSGYYKKTTNNKLLVRMWRKENPSLLLVGM